MLSIYAEEILKIYMKFYKKYVSTKQNVVENIKKIFFEEKSKRLKM